MVFLPDGCRYREYHTLRLEIDNKYEREHRIDVSTYDLMNDLMSNHLVVSLSKY